MVTSIIERKRAPMALSATAIPPALGEQMAVRRSWASRLASENRVPSAKIITLVGTSENFSHARRAASWSCRPRAGLRRRSALPWRFMNGKSSAHHASPITGT